MAYILKSSLMYGSYGSLDDGDRGRFRNFRFRNTIL